LDKIRLDSSVPLVVLQFSFSNPKAVPEWISRYEKEVPQKKAERKARSNGKLIIEPTENCSLLGIAKELRAAGYELINAFCQKRINPKNKDRMYQMVRFVFLRREAIKLPDRFMEARIPALGSLREMCAGAMWRVRIFLNPLIRKGEIIPGKHSLSINLEARTPLRLPEGPPIMVWPRDETGRSMKDVPGVRKIPLGPKWRLTIKGDEISLLEL